MYYIPLNLIDPNPWQPRQASDPGKIHELATSILSYANSHPDTGGLLQLPAGRLVGLDPDQKWSGVDIQDMPTSGDLTGWLMDLGLIYRIQLAYGHRRLEAFKELGSNRLPVELGKYTDEEMATMAWAENNDREDLTPIDRALFAQKIIQDFNLTQEKAAKKLNMSRPAISNLLRLLKLPADVQAHLASGQISPRQADALLSLFSLPEEIRKKAEIHWEENVKPSAILNAAVEGESSENTRKRVTQLTERYAEKLNNAPWSLALVFADYPNRHAPACSQCDARLDEGNWNYCTLPECFRSRYKAFQQDYLQRAGQVCGIPPLEGDRDLYRTTSLYREHAQILATKCENLRLIYEGRHNGAFPHPEGFPEARILCQKQNQFCTCLKGLEQMQKSAARPQAAESQALPDGSQAPDQMQDSALSGPTAEELEDAARVARVAQKERRRQVLDLARQASNLFADAMDRDEPAAWRQLAGKLIGWSRVDDLKELASSEIRRRIADKLSEEHSYDYTGDSRPDDALHRLNEWLKESGLPALRLDGSTAGNDPLSAILRRWGRIQGWLEQNIETAPPYAMRGNHDNLERLNLDLHELIQAGQARADDPLLAEIYGDRGFAYWLDRLEAQHEEA